MREDSLRNLLRYVGCNIISHKTIHKEDRTYVMATCPLPDHPETRPSFGASTKGNYHCFGCQSAGSLIELIMRTCNVTLKKALDIYSDYDEIGEHSADEILRYQELMSKVRTNEWNNGITVDRFKMAVMKSGKAKIDYLLDRGFTRETLKKFMIGYEEESARFTIPIQGLQNELFGFIKGAILPQKIDGEYNHEYEDVYGTEFKYLIDSTIVKSKVLYPLPHYIHDGTAILVEGCLDAMKNHQNELRNTLSIINAEINFHQVDLLRKLGVKRIISMLDDDVAGQKGRERIIKMCRKDFSIYECEYPAGKHDPGELTKEEANNMIGNSVQYRLKKLFYL